MPQDIAAGYCQRHKHAYCLVSQETSEAKAGLSADEDIRRRSNEGADATQATQRQARMTTPSIIITRAASNHPGLASRSTARKAFRSIVLKIKISRPILTAIFRKLVN